MHDTYRKIFKSFQLAFQLRISFVEGAHRALAVFTKCFNVDMTTSTYIDLHCKFFPEFVRLFIFRLRDIQGVSWSPVRLCRPFSRDCCSCCRCCNGSSCSCSNCLSRVLFELLLTIDIFAAFLEGVKNVSPRRKRLLERGDITKPDTDQNRRRACKSLLRLPLACTGLPITVARVR